jgi:hypothetical protein
MVAQRQPQPEFERPSLRVVHDARYSEQDRPALHFENAQEAFSHGFRWGLVVVSLGFWLPVTSALYVWLS